MDTKTSIITLLSIIETVNHLALPFFSLHHFRTVNNMKFDNIFVCYISRFKITHLFIFDVFSRSFFLFCFSTAVVAQLKAIRLGAPWRLSLNLTDVFHLSKVKEPANYLTKSKTNNQQTNKTKTTQTNKIKMAILLASGLHSFIGKVDHIWITIRFVKLTATDKARQFESTEGVKLKVKVNCMNIQIWKK